MPLAVDEAHKENLELLENWLRSYRPEELFDESGKLIPELAELAPTGPRRMGANIHANGGKLLRELQLPNFRDYAVDIPYPSIVNSGNTHALGPWLRDVIKLNEGTRRLPHLCPRRDHLKPARSGIRRNRSTMERAHSKKGMIFLLKMVAFLMPSSANTKLKAGSKATSSPVATVCSIATRHLFASSTQWSASMQNG